jgi:hypothetical protein
MTFKQYTKKPVTVEAIQFTGHNFDDVEKFAGKSLGRVCNNYLDGRKNDWSIVIKTLEGDMKASPGDYIIRGINGEYYPCKPDIFVKTYDEGEGNQKEAPKYDLITTNQARERVLMMIEKEKKGDLQKYMKYINREIELACDKGERYTMVDKSSYENLNIEAELILDESGYKVASNVGGFAIQW